MLCSNFDINKKLPMLKLIAEDFIQVDKIDLVLPLYQQLVEQGFVAQSQPALIRAMQD